MHEAAIPGEMQSVFKFEPLYKERPWGGQAIAKVGLGRALPSGKKIGEAWELVDREEDQSIVAEGQFKGRSIRWLLEEKGAFIMGKPWPKPKRYPLLIKILDAHERLSLQVHPPAASAPTLKSEPKTEMWYLLHAQPHAALMAGIKNGVTRSDFETALKGTGSQLEPLVHRIKVERADAIFIPSGRIHAIDAGCLILEIQQNSDTTYRVCDWGRVGLDGKPRQLHVEETMQCTDFNDFEPKLVARQAHDGVRSLAECDYFQSELWTLNRAKSLPGKTSIVLHSTKGDIEITGEGAPSVVKHGETALLAAVPHLMTPNSGIAEVVVTYCS